MPKGVIRGVILRNHGRISTPGTEVSSHHFLSQSCRWGLRLSLPTCEVSATVLLYSEQPWNVKQPPDESFRRLETATTPPLNILVPIFGDRRQMRQTKCTELGQRYFQCISPKLSDIGRINLLVFCMRYLLFHDFICHLS